jgi:hypothetical protein
MNVRSETLLGLALALLSRARQRDTYLYTDTLSVRSTNKYYYPIKLETYSN